MCKLVIPNHQFSIILYLCTVKPKPIVLLYLLLFLCLGCQKQPGIDPLTRARVDGLNKDAFINRYRHPDSCLAYSEHAIQLIADSLPAYTDGYLRALNNRAFAFYQMSNITEATSTLDRIEELLNASHRQSHNGDIEWVIAQLRQACLLQRQCRIAESFQRLYEVECSGILDQRREDLLYNYARAEYYITVLVLNFHYRDGQVSSLQNLLEDIEKARPGLQVDYAQDMALNYALAYGWQCTGENTRALDYCNHNFSLLERPSLFCLYHYANTLQMTAVALKGMPGVVPPDSVLNLYDEAREAFFDYGDPYQMLGGVTSTAAYALLIGDTATAHTVLGQWLSMHDVWTPFSAPKLETSLFDVLIRSRYASSPDDNRRWHERHCELQAYVVENEKADFDLQQNLAEERQWHLWMSRAALIFALLLLFVLALLVLLWRNARRLQREKDRLEAANRRDVERIASVETCLSVLRHDVSPFVGYLRNPDLTPELRNEVLDQLLHTFENIKSWTRLSVPDGLTFRSGRFPLQQVFDDTSLQVPTPHNGVSLEFNATPLWLWADRLLVVVLLRNLVANAIQHTTSGHIAIKAAPCTGEMVDISISDTGSGMTPQQVESLFRADRHLPEGSEHGFGLMLCRYIIQKHDDLTRRGCRIEVDSSPGEGTTVHVFLASTKPHSL